MNLTKKPHKFPAAFSLPFAFPPPTLLSPLTSFSILSRYKFYLPSFAPPFLLFRLTFLRDSPNLYSYSNYLFLPRLCILSAFVSDFTHQSCSVYIYELMCDGVKISAATRGSFESLRKGQRSVPSAHLFPKEAEMTQRCYRRRSWRRERERFRSFTTFSVFVRLKAKGKGSLCGRSSIRLLLSGGPSSGRAPETLHGPRSFISNASDTRALFSTCTRRIHRNVRASCTYTRTLISSLHGGQVGVTRTALAGFLEDKGVTSLPEIEVCHHDIILTLKPRVCEIKNVNIILYYNEYNDTYVMYYIHNNIYNL